MVVVLRRTDNSSVVAIASVLIDLGKNRNQHDKENFNPLL